MALYPLRRSGIGQASRSPQRGLPSSPFYARLDPIRHLRATTVHRQISDGLPTYHFESLNAEALVHAVFTRLGGVSSGPFATLNVGSSVGDDPASVAENQKRVHARLGVSADQVATAHLVHGNHVAVVEAQDAGRVFPATDALVTTAPGMALLLRFADCQPILLYDPVNHALGLVHAGWRGVALGIARRAVETMQSSFGSDPASLLAGLGPAIGPCCYIVGDNVATAMGYALPNWRQVMKLEDEGWRLDLPAANAQQLAAAGVQHIEHADLCTCTHSDEFFSHRATQGHTGRFAMAAYLKPRKVADVAGHGPAADRGLTPTDEEPHSSQEPSTLNPPGLPAIGELWAEDTTRLSRGSKSSEPLGRQA